MTVDLNRYLIVWNPLLRLTRVVDVYALYCLTQGVGEIEIYGLSMIPGCIIAEAPRETLEILECGTLSGSQHIT